MSRVSSFRSDSIRWPQLYWGVAFTTLATLLLELALTRIFSVVFYYHFAFLAISIALFGLGAGGVLSYVIAARPGTLFTKLGNLALANAVLAVAAIWFLLSIRQELSAWLLALVYLVSALPFICSGAIVSLAISEAIERIDRVYFFDLMGAAAGCLLLVPLLNSIGGPSTVIAVATIFGISAAIWFNLANRRRSRVIAVVLSLALVLFAIFNVKGRWVDVHYAKGQPLPQESFTRWNSFSRIGVVPDRQSGGNLIVIDGDASTGIANFDFNNLDPNTRFTLLHEGPGFVYTLRPGAKTLIIGPGGGWDVSRALASGSKDVTGVEINPIIANVIMRERLPQLSNRLYFRPDVNIHIEDGRSFVRRSNDKYQVIQMTLVDTWASTAAGAFALSENNLYTTDAFHDYLSRLTDDGVLAITRWGFDPPRESLRLLSLARDAFARLGETQPDRHVIVLRENEDRIRGWGATDTILISRKPFTEADLALARGESDQQPKAKIRTVYSPLGAVESGSWFARLLKEPALDQFYESYPFDVRPVSDDRPFFFYTVQSRDVLNYLSTAQQDTADFKINRAVPLLFALLGVSLVATLVVLVLPRLLLRTPLPTDGGVLGFLPYFLAIGIGYILAQVALIQKFVLLLGHPTYALTVIVFSMLVASGLGSFWSHRFIGNNDSRWLAVLGGAALLIALLAIVARFAVAGAVGWPLPAKMLLTAVLIAPAAFLMGMPFPSGLARLEEIHSPSVRWAWSLNAAASVLGSAGAIFLAIYIGLQNTMIAAAVCYLAAIVATLGVRRARASTAVTTAA